MTAGLRGEAYVFGGDGDAATLCYRPFGHWVDVHDRDFPGGAIRGQLSGR